MIAERIKRLLASAAVILLMMPAMAQQQKNITMTADNMPLKEFLQALGEQSGYSFFYTNDVLSKASNVTVNVQNSDIETVLGKALAGSGLTYEMIGSKIAIKMDPNAGATLPGKTGVDSGETITVKGIVVDENGDPLPGVAVMIAGTLKGVVTDLDGKYTIQGKVGTELQCSYLGYRSTNVKIGSKETARIQLTSENVALESVVVTALGIKRDEKSIGYSAAKVDSEKFGTSATSSNWLNGLTGQVAGLNIDRANSGPGGSMRVTIRGEATADLENNSALFVIDGVPMYNTSTASDSGDDGASFAVDYGDGTSDINPEEIESVTVLKGAAATALYGSSAANGAIIITTKGAGLDDVKLKVSYTLSFAMDKVLQSPDLQYEYGQGSSEYDYYYFSSLTGDGVIGGDPLKHSTSGMESWGPKMDGTIYYQYYDKTRGIGGHFNNYGDFERDATPFISYGNWFADYFRTGTTLRNNITLTGRINKDNSLRVAFTDGRYQNIVPDSPSNAQSINLRSQHRLAKWLTAETAVNYYRKFNKNIPVSAGYGSTAIMYGLWCYAPNIDMNWPSNYWLDDKQIEQDDRLSGGKNNAYFLANECTNSQTRDRIYGNVKLDAQIVKGLDLMVRGGIDMTDDFRKQQQGTSTQARPQGWYREQTIRSRQYYGDFLLKYKQKFGRFDLTANLGGSLNKREYARNSQTASNLKLPKVYTLANSLSEVRCEDYSYEKLTSSIFGMVQFAYDNCIFLDVTGRNDWSSTLPKNNRSYFYPSVSGSIALNDLFDFGRTNGLINLMKVRASWAQVGNDTAPYRIENFLATTGYPGTLQIPNTRTNSKLLPEIVSSWEVGLEMRMFKNRFTFDAAFYDSVTKNLISSMPISYATGASSIFINAGSIRNRGVEIAVGGTLVKTRDISWKVDLNWNKNVNKVLSLGDGIDSWIVANYSTHAYMTAYEGSSITGMYGKGYQRAPEGSVAIDESGKMVDVSGMLLLNKENMPQTGTELQYLGDVAPLWKGGFNTTFKWKDLSLYVGFDGQFGGHVYSYTNWVLNYRGKGRATLVGRDGDFVPQGVRMTDDGNFVINTEPISKANISNYYHCFYEQTNAEAHFVETSFLKLRSVKLEYKLPKKVLAKTKVLSGVSVSVYGNNLYCWSKFPGFDPEAVTMRGSALIPGFEICQMPGTAQFGATLNVTF